MTQEAANPEIGTIIDVNGIATNVHDVGEATDSAPIVLVHGSGPGVSSWANWRPVLSAFAEHTRVIAPDIVGFGYTVAPKDFEFNRQQWVDHLIALLDELGLERVSLVGNSFGGGLSLWLALQHPERVERLVLMGSVGADFPITQGLDDVWGYEPSIDSMRNVMQYFTHDKSRITEELIQLRYEASKRDGVAEQYSAMFPAPRQRHVDGMAVQPEQLASIDKPTLLVHGRDDQVIPTTVSLDLLQQLPNSELHIFSKCGHWVQIEARDRFVPVVTDFLQL